MTVTPTIDAARSDTGHTLVEVAARLLGENGPTGVTTRAVAEAAGVQAPTIYRLFGDKEGLLNAVAQHVFATYVEHKGHFQETNDPVADLRAGWDMHIEFGLANPALFGLLTDPSRDTRSPATAAGIEILRGRVRRVAASGRLRLAEHHAVELIHAAGTGAVLTLLATPPAHRDLSLVDTMYTAVIQAILTKPPRAVGNTATATAIAFRTIVPNLHKLTPKEKALMTEWLDRAIDTGPTPL